MAKRTANIAIQAKMHRIRYLAIPMLRFSGNKTLVDRLPIRQVHLCRYQQTWQGADQAQNRLAP